MRTCPYEAGENRRILCMHVACSGVLGVLLVVAPPTLCAFVQGLPAAEAPWATLTWSQYYAQCLRCETANYGGFGIISARHIRQNNSKCCTFSQDNRLPTCAVAARPIGLVCCCCRCRHCCWAATPTQTKRRKNCCMLFLATPTCASLDQAIGDWCCKRLG